MSRGRGSLSETFTLSKKKRRHIYRQKKGKNIIKNILENTMSVIGKRC
jgi:hypothetical protein